MFPPNERRERWKKSSFTPAAAAVSGIKHPTTTKEKKKFVISFLSNIKNYFHKEEKSPQMRRKAREGGEKVSAA